MMGLARRSGSPSLLSSLLFSPPPLLYPSSSPLLSYSPLHSIALLLSRPSVPQLIPAWENISEKSTRCVATNNIPRRFECPADPCTHEEKRETKTCVGCRSPKQMHIYHHGRTWQYDDRQAPMEDYCQDILSSS